MERILCIAIVAGVTLLSAVAQDTKPGVKDPFDTYNELRQVTGSSVQDNLEMGRRDNNEAVYRRLQWVQVDIRNTGVIPVLQVPRRYEGEAGRVYQYGYRQGYSTRQFFDWSSTLPGLLQGAYTDKPTTLSGVLIPYAY